MARREGTDSWRPHGKSHVPLVPRWGMPEVSPVGTVSPGSPSRCSPALPVSRHRKMFFTREWTRRTKVAPVTVQQVAPMAVGPWSQDLGLP